MPTSLERVLTALRRGTPDRVPSFEWEVDDVALAALTPGGDLFDFIEWADLDAVAIFADERKRRLTETVYVDEWGVTKAKTEEYYPVPIDAPLKDPTDLKSLKVPDPRSEWHFETLAKAVDRFGGKRAVIFRAQDSFSIPRYLRGVESMLTDFILHPQLVRDMVEIAVAYNSALAQRAVELGANAIFASDDYCDNRGPMMSPRHFQEFLLPGLKQVVSAVHAAGVPFIKHTDGNARPILDDLIASGIDCLDPLDPLGGMDLAEMKARVGPRVCLKGNVNIGGALSLGTPEEVRAETLACLRAGMPGGGYILSTSNSVMASVKPENYAAMLDTLRHYGRYDPGGSGLPAVSLPAAAAPRC
jgi:uroporphyrinogen decarboxylase